MSPRYDRPTLWTLAGILACLLILAFMLSPLWPALWDTLDLGGTR